MINFVSFRHQCAPVLSRINTVGSIFLSLSPSLGL